MIELLRTHDPVQLSACRELLLEADIAAYVFDSITGGILNATVPVRLMVAEDDAALARHLLRQAGVLD
jgi:hypothetical protein